MSVHLLRIVQLKAKPFLRIFIFWRFLFILPIVPNKLSSGQKFHSSVRNYERHLEKTSNSSQSPCPVGRELWEELLEEVILHNTFLCSLLHKLLKDKCMCLQDE